MDRGELGADGFFHCKFKGGYKSFTTPVHLCRHAALIQYITYLAEAH